MAPSTPTIDARGVTLEARFVGVSSPSAPTLVFLHEGLGSVAQWRDFPDRLCARLGLAGLVYSRRGYGKSAPVPPAPRPIRFMHDEAYDVLPAVLEVTKLGSVILVGHSDGASIALLFAAKDQGRYTRGVVVLAPHLFVEDVTVKSIAAITETWHRTAADADGLRARLARYHGDNVDGAFLGWSGVWLDPAFRSWTIEREVAALSVPVLAIQGEDDEYGTRAQIDALARLAPAHVETRILSKCGHSPQRDRPDEAIDATVAWYKTHFEAGRALQSGPLARPSK